MVVPQLLTRPALLTDLERAASTAGAGFAELVLLAGKDATFRAINNRRASPSGVKSLLTIASPEMSRCLTLWQVGPLMKVSASACAGGRIQRQTSATPLITVTTGGWVLHSVGISLL